MIDLKQFKQSESLSIYQSYLSDLKKSGNRYICRCPFHNEKTPSFFIFSDSWNYKCFGCGVRGDIFNFISKLTGKSFKEIISQYGLNQGDFKPNYEHIKTVKINQQRKDDFEAWKANQQELTSKLLFLILNAIDNIQIIEHFELAEKAFHLLEPVFYRFEILFSKNDNSILNLYEYQPNLSDTICQK